MRQSRLPSCLNNLIAPPYAPRREQPPVESGDLIFTFGPTPQRQDMALADVQLSHGGYEREPRA